MVIYQKIISYIVLMERRNLFYVVWEEGKMSIQIFIFSIDNGIFYV